jgi:TusA-related sulfurtransferase
MPLLKIKKELANMASGEILEVLRPDPGSHQDIPKFSKKMAILFWVAYLMTTVLQNTTFRKANFVAKRVSILIKNKSR